MNIYEPRQPLELPVVNLRHSSVTLFSGFTVMPGAPRVHQVGWQIERTYADRTIGIFSRSISSSNIHCGTSSKSPSPYERSVPSSRPELVKQGEYYTHHQTPLQFLLHL